MFIRHPLRTLRLMLSAETPMLAKVLLLAVIGYVIFPFDILPDLVPLVGQIDDVTFTLLVVSYALARIPDSAYEKAGLDPAQVKDIMR